MAEQEKELELEVLKKELESLFVSNSSEQYGLQSKLYCVQFCKLVEVYTGRWQVPLPQLQVLQTALSSFVQASAGFPCTCEHVHYTLSSLALSVFELLLFLKKENFVQDPLKDILDSFQECFSHLDRHQNIHLLQVKQIIREKGPWASPVLQAILKDTALPQDEVERYIGSEVPVFFELRVRYLLSCFMIQEAVVLAKTCSQHLTAGRNLFFLQAYLTCLCKASLYDHMRKEMWEVDGKDAVDIVCNTEREESDDTLLALCRAFLSQQLLNGDMYYMWDLVFIWSKLCLRVNPSKQALLEESHQLLLSATDIKSIFPFMRVILAELGKDGLQFCVELCTHALQTDRCDTATKSLLYKTVAYLLPNDLEICRACALLVFFLERTVEAYKTVFLLYTHPDEEYYAEAGPIRNHVRFEILQTLKRGLYFDPEFWNLLNLRTNCLKLMSEKKAALARIMEEDKWVSSYCSNIPKETCRGWATEPSEHLQTRQVAETKQPQMKQAPVKHIQIKPFHQVTEPKKRFHRDEKNNASTAPVDGKRVKTQSSEKTVGKTSAVEPPRQPVSHLTPAMARQAKTKSAKKVEPPVVVEEQPVVKRRGRKPGPKPRMRSPVRVDSSAESSVRRSVRQLDTVQDNLDRQGTPIQHRHMTRLSEKKPPKRLGRKPRWLLEGTFQAETSAPRRGRKPGRKPQQQKTQVAVEKAKNSPCQSSSVKETKTKPKNAGNSQSNSPAACLAAREPECTSEDIPDGNHLPAVSLAPDLKLEVSQPDNELVVFPEDQLRRQGLVFVNCDLSKPPAPAQFQEKDRFREEFIFPTQNPSLFIQQLHSYARVLKTEGVSGNAETCALKPTDVRPYLNQSCLPELDAASAVFYQMSAVEMKGEVSSQTATPTATAMTVTSQGFFIDKDAQQKCIPFHATTNVMNSNNPGRRRARILNIEGPKEPTKVINVPKELTSTEVSDVLESSSRETEVTDILKEAMSIANIGLEEAMMDDTDTGISDKDIRVLVDPTPTFCWLSNTSMNAFAREFEKFAKGKDTVVLENHEAVTAQATGNILRKTLATSPSLEDTLQDIIPENAPKVNTEPVVVHKDTSLVKQLNPKVTDALQDTQTGVEHQNIQQVTGLDTNPKDIPTPFEYIPQITDDTRQLEEPLKVAVLQRSMWGIIHTVDSPEDNTPKFTKVFSENAQNIQQPTEDNMNATMGNRTETLPKVTADALQVTEDRTKATVDTAMVSTGNKSEVVEVFLQNRDDTCPLKSPQKTPQDTSMTTGDSGHCQIATGDSGHCQMVTVETTDVPIVTVDSGYCLMFTEDVLKISENVLKDSKDASKECKDILQNTQMVSKDACIPRDRARVNDHPDKDNTDPSKVTDVASKHPDDSPENPSMVTEDNIDSPEICGTAPEPTGDPSDVNEDTQQITDLSGIVEDTPKVTKGVPHNTQDNSLVTSNVSKSAHTPKVSKDTSKDPDYMRKVTKSTPKITRETPQKGQDSPKVTKEAVVSRDTLQNPEGIPQETGDGQLAYRCSLCNKIFNGNAHVAAHAMYHFRRDQCMFCRMLFKNDLIAMMHLSEHIDKLKKGNVHADIQGVHENCPPGLPEKPERSAQKGRRGRKRISVLSTDTRESSPPNCRKLRSTNRLSTDLHPETRVETEECDAKQSIERVNGHIGKRRVKVEGMEHDGDFQRPEQKQQKEEQSCLETREEPVEHSTTSVKIATWEQNGASSNLTKTLKEVKPCSSAKTVEAKTGSASLATGPQDRLSVSPIETSAQGKESSGCCPVEGCTETFPGKMRSILGHILDDHRSDTKCLETAFCHWNGKCSICQKPGLTLQHYQHHVEQHRGSPRHPCLHRGCKARFGAVAEMRKHAKTHQPLQAVCCFPGCKEQLGCFLELNRHEREHYPLPKEQTYVPVVGSTSVKETDELHQMGEKGRWDRREKETSTAASATTVKVTRKCNLTKKETQVIGKRQVRKSRNNNPHPVITGKAIDKLQGKRKLCIGKKVSTSTSTTKAKQAEKVTKKLKMMNKLKKAQASKSRHISSEKDTSTPPSITTTAQKVTKNVKVINKLLKMQVIKKKTISKKMYPLSSQATDVTKKLKVTDDFKKTKQALRKTSVGTKRAVLKPSVGTESTKASGVETDVDTATPPSTESNSKNCEPRNTKITPPQTCKTTPKTPKTTPSKSTIKEEVVKNAYIRPLRSAHLDENYTTVTKRRKVTSWVPQHSQAHLDAMEATPTTQPIQRLGAKRQWARREKASTTNTKVTREYNLTKKLEEFPVTKKPQVRKGQSPPTAHPPAITVKATNEFKDLRVTRKSRVKNVSTTEQAEKVTKKLKMINNLKKVQAAKSRYVGKKKSSSTPPITSSTTTSNPIILAEIVTRKPKLTDELKKKKRHVQKPSLRQDPKNTDSVDMDTNPPTVLPTTESKSKNCKPQNTKPTTSTLPSGSSTAPPTSHTVTPTTPPPLKTPFSPSSPKTLTTLSKTPIAPPKSPAVTPKSPIRKDEGTTSFYGMIGNKPYIRPPPTAYLDESYTTMQKRRKEMSWAPHHSPTHLDPVEAVLAVQRQRCTKCFLPFNSPEELQTHLSLKKCTALFGFDDSDEDGNR
ncbi:uncharacterized protein LOC105020102 [Esox lucius]|uniref:C2H2-type domain-containing protein n=1 Tax=Esox lucius TaxID=8010 RepID=A0AAY5KAZ6_ESOLU|nr:uncharacterized protein LOC105020102 [Esox lucius]